MGYEDRQFPDFSLERLLKTVFDPQINESICILIELADPQTMKGFGFLNDESLTVQHYAYNIFYKGLKEGLADTLGLKEPHMYAYKVTGGSNLDLPDTAMNDAGLEVPLNEKVYSRYDIILCISEYSATAPLTAKAKQFGFRGATLHGLNQIIIETGLAVDYEAVSDEAEKLRQGLTRAQCVEVDFQVGDHAETLKIILDEQEAQKSHGLCRGKNPDVANLPAGEVYFVPTGAEGTFPMKYEDGTLGWMRVREGRIYDIDFISGNLSVIEEHLKKIHSDPVTGELGELGFGTQYLPFSGVDIQDEKVFGTFHIATGRSDHLGGHLTPDKFRETQNATHDDILFALHKTPEIRVTQVRMLKDGQTNVLIENYEPTEYLISLLHPSN